MVYDAKAYHAKWFRTPHGKKVERINKWKYFGLVHDDYNQLYERYINTTDCDVCHRTFKNSKDRCMDHDHSTGQFRNIICRSCNSRDHWKKVLSARSSCVEASPEPVPSVA